MPNTIDNMRGSTLRVVEENEPLNNKRGVTYRVINVDGGGSGGGLPDQTGNAGKFLTTDGTDASWGTALANKSTASRSLVIGDDAVVNAGTDNVAIGYHTTSANNSSNVAIGAYTNAMNMSTAVGYSATASGSNSVALGNNASSSGNYSIAVGNLASTSGSSIGIGKSSSSQASCISLGAYAYTKNESIAIGQGSSTSYRTEADYYGLAIGNSAKATNYNIAIGDSTQAGAYGIVIGGATKGYKGGAHSILMVAGANSWNVSGASPVGSIILDAIDNKNSSTPYSGCQQNSFYVGLASTLWKVLDGTTGLFSPNRIASTTGLADGTYVLKMTIVDGTPTLSWVAE